MSVIVDLSIFPLDKGHEYSEHVARVIRIIRESGVSHQLGCMGTALEGGYDEVMDVVGQCFKALEQDSDRVYLALKMDYRKGRERGMEGKVRSVEEKLSS